MITIKRFRNIEELQKLQALALRCKRGVTLQSPDGSILVDCKSFINLFALDFTRPVLVVSDDADFHKKIAYVGHTLDFQPESLPK